MRPVILIPARMASTRLPDKPLADIGGEPMIVRVWQRAMEAKLGEVVVACDGEAIADAIRAAGGKAVITDPNLPSGSDRIWKALTVIDADGKYDAVINVQGDMPTLNPAIIGRAVSLLDNPQVDIATLAAPIHEEWERDDPAVVKATLVMSGTGEGRALNFSRKAPPSGDYFHHIGIYAYRRAALQKFVSLPPSSLEIQEKLEQLRAMQAGMRIDVAVVDTVPLGVDTPETLEKARAWYAQH